MIMTYDDQEGLYKYLRETASLMAMVEPRCSAIHLIPYTADNRLEYLMVTNFPLADKLTKKHVVTFLHKVANGFCKEILSPGTIKNLTSFRAHIGMLVDMTEEEILQFSELRPLELLEITGDNLYPDQVMHTGFVTAGYKVKEHLMAIRKMNKEGDSK